MANTPYEKFLKSLFYPDININIRINIIMKVGSLEIYILAFSIKPSTLIIKIAFMYIIDLVIISIYLESRYISLAGMYKKLIIINK